MADNLIRWKRGDYVRLSKAVNKFNKQVNELSSKGINYVPDVKNYQSLKENIYTRKELNRTINSLKKFSIENAKKVELPSGKQLTSWEYKELKLARNRARKYLEGKLEIQQKENPYAKYGIDTKEVEITKKTIESLNRLETKAEGFELNRLIDRINRLGSYDDEMKKAVMFKKNYMESLEQMSNYHNYDLLRAKLDSIKNPEQFYEFIEKSPTLSDLFDYYHDSPEAQTIAGFDNNQEAFNRALQELGILDEDYDPQEYDLSDVSNKITSLE